MEMTEVITVKLKRVRKKKQMLYKNRGKQVIIQS